MSEDTNTDTFRDFLKVDELNEASLAGITKKLNKAAEKASEAFDKMEDVLSYWMDASGEMYPHPDVKKYSDSKAHKTVRSYMQMMEEYTRYNEDRWAANKEAAAKKKK
jgi:DNA-directed RNA polymerase delta subunit